MRIPNARARFERIPYAGLLGVHIGEVAHERAVLSLPYQAAHANPGGVLNGGATASLMNMAGTLAAWTGVDLGPQPYLGTVDFSIQYLGAAFDEEVVASARVLRRGRDLFFLEARVHTPEDKPICQGLLIYRAPDYGGQPRRTYAVPELLPEPPTEAGAVSLPAVPRLGDFVQKLQVAMLHESPGRVRLSMPCTPQHVDEASQMHEGALAAVADIAGTAAAWTMAQRQGSRGATIGMQLSYLHAVREPIFADAVLQQRSEELFFSRVQITTAATRQLVAMGNVSYRILEPRCA